ncbi:MAG: hypothetical protein COB20_01690 [SAR86 cluster bacterium]|uniref:Uncharacterized protein n=1 Tax=SAR86 cluster bacterium TaxID=2030880 RepID=A0A2A4XFV8_9GAMM|nr:MAG: hypothetical protein COB20_01690 [SAR86 cluster bacterium]
MILLIDAVYSQVLRYSSKSVIESSFQNNHKLLIYMLLFVFGGRGLADFAPSSILFFTRRSCSCWVGKKGLAAACSVFRLWAVWLFTG